MAETLRQVRRAATQLAIRQAIAATAAVPPSAQRSLVRSLVGLAGGAPMLRRRVREHMRLALGSDPPAGAERRYFSHVSWFLSNALATFHHGVGATPVTQQATLDSSVRALDEASAEGRGVVLVAPHWTGHELFSALIHQRHPMTMLVRQAPTSERAARKLKWYAALGVEIVLRPDRQSTIRDAAAYLRILKAGKMLAITPDLLAEPGEGVETRIFGRRARIHGGAFALAIMAKAPMIRVSGYWPTETSAVVTFDSAPLPNVTDDRDAAVRAAAQDWCNWFERELAKHPENWLFWLDKRWSRLLRTVPRTSGDA